MSEMEKYYMKESVETELCDDLTDEEFDKMLVDWHQFATNPREYGYAPVIDMVGLWLRGIRGVE